MAKQMLLPVSEVEMWSKHISNVATARKLGAKKAAATRKEKHSTRSTPEVPEVEKEEEGVADTEELWCHCQVPEYGFMIKCDKQGPRCHIWYHGRCVKISKKRAKKIDRYICYYCKDTVYKEK
ncbi:PHD finger protein Alfin1-like [Acropora millepora]|uniref:PHD finger protein Alfin1-like n=1 Tax=Acropora millepora TaxID=45264 RepID=UPI001CF304D5|nr:PHD finger protein Alfin1-like [Acropora millepora]